MHSLINSCCETRFYLLRMVLHSLISRDGVLTKRCGNASRNITILKQLPTLFEAQHEKVTQYLPTFLFIFAFILF